MTNVLYTLEFPFQAKTFESIDPHVSAESAYLPLRPTAKQSTEEIEEVDISFMEVGYINRQIREVDPDVVIVNHNYRHKAIDFQEEYPTVHLRHGASIGRGTVEDDVEEVFPLFDAALAPGGWWADQYRETEADLTVETVGVPEADPLVGTDAPRERRVLYAPTNLRYGGGSLMNTAEDVLDLFAETEYELLFRPHPHDCLEQPARDLVRRCRERICELPNVTFDDSWLPIPSLLAADLLVSDYSGIITEWLHTGRPFVQLTNIRSEQNSVPEIGYATDKLRPEMVDDLYENGLPPATTEQRDRWLEDLEIPMDGHAGERAASFIESYIS